MSTHHKRHPASCSTRSSYTAFYVLFMLCKRCPIIVKISKQIVKIDLLCLPIDLQSSAKFPQKYLHLWSSLPPFAGRVSIEQSSCVCHIGSICVSAIYMYLGVSICISAWARVCACQWRDGSPQPEEAHKFCDLIKLASLENCLNFLLLPEPEPFCVALYCVYR